MRVMGDIYSKAHCVRVWLGLSNEILDRIFQKSNQRVTGFGPVDSEVFISGMKRLLGLEYWHRVWIVQEIVRAKSLEFHCGSNVLHEARFRELCRYAERYLSENYWIDASGTRIMSARISNEYFSWPCFPLLLVTRRRHESGAYQSTAPQHKAAGQAVRRLGPLLLTHRHSQCTEPRDKVFALHTLCYDPPNSQILVPDYSISTTRLLASTTGSTNILIQSQQQACR